MGTRVQANTQTQYVTRTQVQQQVSTEVVPTTIYSTVVQQSVVSRPGQTRISTVTRTVVRTEQLPGQQQTVFNTRYVTNTNYVTSTIANNQFSTVVVTSTVQPQ